MNNLNCLSWCRQVRHQFPDDLRTAVHVREWLADSAERAASNEADAETIAEVRQAAAFVEAAHRTA